MEKYKPISCEFYDYIEHYAMRREVIEIRFRDQDGTVKTIHDMIGNTRIYDGEEFIVLKNHPQIRMDQIISLNEHKLDQYPSC
jgi:Rho-binding antiterminator